MSVHPSSSRSTPPLPSFPQPPSFSSSPSRVRRAPPAFPPPTAAQPYASTSSFRLQHGHQPSLDSPTTPASVRVHRRSPSSNGSEDGSRPLPTTRQVYGGAVPRNRNRSSTVGGAGGAGGGASLSPPKEYVLSKLRELAPMFHREDSNADITVLVPISLPSLTPSTSDQESYRAQSGRRDSGTSAGPSTTPMETDEGRGARTPPLGRRGSAPSSGEVTVRTYHLHREYLTTQSTLFKKLLHPSTSAQTPTLPPTPTASRTSNPSLSARLIPSQPPSTRPTILLPLPDPDSFGLLVHYLYFGNAAVVERALGERKVEWKGLFSNIEYLGLDTPLKLICSRWWRTWIRPTTTTAGSSSSSASRSSASSNSPSSAFSHHHHPYGQQPRSAGSSASSDQLATPPPPGMGYASSRERYEQVTPTMSTFPRGKGMGDRGPIVRIGEDDDGESEREGLREEELERRMRELGRRGST